MPAREQAGRSGFHRRAAVGSRPGQGRAWGRCWAGGDAGPLALERAALETWAPAGAVWLGAPQPALWQRGPGAREPGKVPAASSAWVVARQQPARPPVARAAPARQELPAGVVPAGWLCRARAGPRVPAGPGGVAEASLQRPVLPVREATESAVAQVLPQQATGARAGRAAGAPAGWAAVREPWPEFAGAARAGSAAPAALRGARRGGLSAWGPGRAAWGETAAWGASRAQPEWRTLPCEPGRPAHRAVRGRGC
jgi:hypothetical protein